MDNQALYEYLELISQNSQQIGDAIAQMQETIYKLVEENSHLKIENAHLRQRLDQEENHTEKKDNISSLEKLYDSGIHICHNFYGAKRDEVCLLCESLLRKLDE